VTTIDLHEAIRIAGESARQLGEIAHSARRQVVELTVELEEARQELGRLRARDEQQVAVLRRIVDENVEAVVDASDVLFDVRVLLGLDGRDGSQAVDRG
jgi:hypothetical protein